MTTEESESEKHLRKLLDFERKQRKEERDRLHLYIDQLKRDGYRIGAAQLLGYLDDGIVWERVLGSKAKAAGARHVVDMLKRIAAVQNPDEK